MIWTWTMPRRLNAAEVPLHWVLYLGGLIDLHPQHHSKYLNVPRFWRCVTWYTDVYLYIYYIQYRCILHQFAGYLHDMSCIELLVGECKPSTTLQDMTGGPLGPPWSDPSMPESDGTMDDSWWLNISVALEYSRGPSPSPNGNGFKYTQMVLGADQKFAMWCFHRIPFLLPLWRFDIDMAMNGECVTELLSRTRLWQSVSLRHIKECMLNVSLQSTEASWGDAKDCETMLDMRQVML